MAEHSRPLGGGREVWVDFEELNAKGWAEVIEERPCPKISPGPGRVVTATITHANDDVRTLTMNSGETLHVTGNHRMFSATRQDWVPVKDLHLGEALRTTKGRESVAALGYQKGRHQVYNLEVETEHCYFVGNGEVLTHNTCGVYQITNSEKNEQYTGSSLEVERRLSDPKHPAADLLKDPNTKVEITEVDVSHVAGKRDKQRGLFVVEQDVMNENNNKPKATNSNGVTSLNKQKALRETKHEKYRERTQPKRGKTKRK